MEHQLKEEIKDNLEPDTTQDTSKNISGFDVINIKKEKDETNLESNTATTFGGVEEHESEKQISETESIRNEKAELYDCPYCKKKVKGKRRLTQHKCYCIAERKYECSKCNKKFKAKRGLRTHMQTHLTKRIEGKKPFKCKICDKMFCYDYLLQQHLPIHTDEKPYKCSECDKRYFVKKSLTTHKRIHHLRNGQAAIEKLHQCEHCDKKFIQRNLLINHKRVHTDERPFECSKCDKKYTCRGPLKAHMQSHMEKTKKPIPCGMCHKSYAGRNTLKIHMNIHTREKLFKCSLCDREFLHKSSCKTHLLTHKKEKLMERPHSNSGEMLLSDDSMGEIKSKFKTIKAEKIDVNEIAIIECTNTEKVKPLTDGKSLSRLPYKSCFGETICKEEVILPDERI